MNKISFESVPATLAQLVEEVSELKQLLLEKANQQQPEPDRWLTLTELCQYHPDKPSRATVYGWVNASLIPVHKTKGGKKLRFLKSEIDALLMADRKKTVSETEADAIAFLNRK